jgi:RHS repeat-associated protein
MHAAGVGGYGGSSYVDHVVLRERDVPGAHQAEEDEPKAPDGVLEERRYILQNWRYDVIGVVTALGSLIERRRYDAYGRPISVSPADVGAQGGVEGTDGYLSNNDAASYNTLYFGGQVKWSTDLADGTTCRPNGALNASDYARFNDYFNAGYTGGLGLVSSAEVDLRRGYAGYQYDEILAGSGIISDKIVSKYHVRHRVLSSDDGKWNRRDPLGFVDGMGLYEYVRSSPMTGVDPMGLIRVENHANSPADKHCTENPYDYCVPDAKGFRVSGEWNNKPDLVVFFGCPASANAILFWDQLRRSCPKNCLPVVVTCMVCPPGGTQGFTTPVVGTPCSSVTICTNNLGGETIQQVINHELEHVLQFCRGQLPFPRTCTTLIRAEMRAYRAGGPCRGLTDNQCCKTRACGSAAAACGGMVSCIAQCDQLFP